MLSRARLSHRHSGHGTGCLPVLSKGQCPREICLSEILSPTWESNIGWRSMIKRGPYKKQTLHRSLFGGKNFWGVQNLLPHQHINLEVVSLNHALVNFSLFKLLKFSISYRPVCFIFKRARPPRHFLIGTGAFQGHQGNDQRAWRQSPSLLR